MNPLTTYAPFRYLLITEQWREGRNRWTFPFQADTDQADALEQAQRTADAVPGRNLITLQKLDDRVRGTYADQESYRPEDDGRYLPPLPEPEEPEEPDGTVDNPLLAKLGEMADRSRAANAAQ